MRVNCLQIAVWSTRRLLVAHCRTPLSIIRREPTTGVNCETAVLCFILCFIHLCTSVSLDW